MSVFYKMADLVPFLHYHSNVVNIQVPEHGTNIMHCKWFFWVGLAVLGCLAIWLVVHPKWPTYWLER